MQEALGKFYIVADVRRVVLLFVEIFDERRDFFYDTDKR